MRVQARDVAIATERPRGLSSHNILSATIIGIEPAGAHEMFVRLEVGTTMLARLTRDAASQLGLRIGQEVLALVKSTVFDHG